MSVVRVENNLVQFAQKNDKAGIMIDKELPSKKSAKVYLIK